MKSKSVEINHYISQEWEFYPLMNDDTRAVAEFIWSNAKSGAWLDLGCGPTLTVWPLFSKNPTRISGLDRNKEVLDFHTNLLNNTDLPGITEAYKKGNEFRNEKKSPQYPSPFN